MIPNTLVFAAVSVALTGQVSAHIALWSDTMYGFNQSNFPTNRPQDPLYNLTFKEWWFHDHLPYPPDPNKVMPLPVGGDAVVELSCDKGATSWYASGPGGDARDLQDPDNPCPRAPIAEFHTNGIDDLGGCALAVAYKSDANDVVPEDLVIFSVQHKCVWNLHTHFEIPADMPPCPNGNCICSWHWIHLPDSGSEQMYMNGFKCNFTGATSTRKLAKPKVARRCGAEGELKARPWNCTYGAKSPLFWLQAEGNNMFEGYYSPPIYQDLYNFVDGAQNDIFEDSIITTPLPPSSTGLPTSSPDPNIPNNVQPASVQTSPSSSPTPSSSSTPTSSPTPSYPPTLSPPSTPSSYPILSPPSTPSSSPTPLPSSTPSSSPIPSPSSTPSYSLTLSPSSTPSSSSTPVTDSQSTTSTEPMSVRPSHWHWHHHKHKHSGGSCGARSYHPERRATSNDYDDNNVEVGSSE